MFTRIPFAIDPLCTRLEGSSLLGLFIRLPRFSNPSLFFFLSFPGLRFFPSLLSSPLLLLPISFSSFSTPAATNSMPDNKGDCMYYLGCLPHACPDSSQSTFESRHDRYKPVCSRNAMRSNRTLLVFCHGLEIHTLYTWIYTYMCAGVYAVRKGYFRIIG